MVAIFLSNLPKSIGSASEMTAHGRERRFVVELWVVVAAMCTPATLARLLAG